MSLDGVISGKVEVGTKKDQQENSTACAARESDVQVSRASEMINNDPHCFLAEQRPGPTNG